MLDVVVEMVTVDVVALADELVEDVVIVLTEVVLVAVLELEVLMVVVLV